MPHESTPSPATRHRWRAKPRPPGRRECELCRASSQPFPTRLLVPEHRSTERGTTLFRAPDKAPDGWRVRAGECIPEELAGLPLLEAPALEAVRRSWEALELARWGRDGDLEELEDGDPLDPPCRHRNDPTRCPWCASGEEPEHYP